MDEAVDSVECQLDADSTSNAVYNCQLLPLVPRTTTTAQQTAKRAVRSASVSCTAGITNYDVIFTALHGMQMRSSDENSVCPSVSLSICQTRGL